jgi:hypothetical protein
LQRYKCLYRCNHVLIAVLTDGARQNTCSKPSAGCGDTVLDSGAFCSLLKFADIWAGICASRPPYNMRWAPGMAAALLLASLASHASALGPVSPAGTPDVVFNGKEGPKVLMAKDDATAAVTQQLLAALARSAEAFVKGTDVPAGPSIAAAAPANVSAATVASVMGSIMAASVFEVIASRTLGDPKFYP